MNNRLTAVAALIVLGFVQSAGAVVLLSEEAALAQMFPGADEVTSEDVALTSAKLGQIKEQLGGKWTLYQGGVAAEGDEDSQYGITFYRGISGGEVTGTAMIETQPGKWGPVTYIIAVGNDGKVKDLAVMSYVEKRGRPIALRSFLGQFVGKGPDDKLMVGKDVQAITGATISCRATAFAVKKVVEIYRASAGTTPAVD